jgi:hypothetical protein
MTNETTMSKAVMSNGTVYFATWTPVGWRVSDANGWTLVGGSNRGARWNQLAAGRAILRHSGG